MLKLSGELFQSERSQIDFARFDIVARQVIQIRENTNVEMAMVPGGGNIIRGRDASIEVDRAEADFMGMLATIINGIGLREALVRNGATDTRLMTTIGIPEVAERFIRIKGRYHLENKRLVIIAGGLGRPYFSTDSAVAQFANEFDCDMILKASTVDGVYDSDPRKNTSAKRYPELTYREAIHQRLRVMDQTAFTMCEESGIPIFVFDIKDLARLPEAIRGDYSFGTIIKE